MHEEERTDGGSAENAEAEADGMVDEDGKAEGGSKQQEEMEVERTDGAADQSNGQEEDGEKAEQPSEGDERPPELEQLQETAAGTGDQEMEKGRGIFRILKMHFSGVFRNKRDNSLNSFFNKIFCKNRFLTEFLFRKKMIFQ